MAIQSTDSLILNHEGNPQEVTVQEFLDFVVANANAVAAQVTALSGVALTLADLPTADPAVEGQLWNDSGVVTVSAGA